ncbi:MAG: MFS transporter [Candidatus Fonsibacter sp.]|jgi:PAT family beta-lactamase induction signal transducer AmpG|nr:MFS transporter [Candidatus Fonsibacter sp.]
MTFSYLSPLFNPKSLRMLFLGFAAGLPILLIFSTLSVWLFKAGVNRATITLFSWVGFAYSFKFIWTPIVDNLKLPILGKLGHRRSWLLLSQLMIILSLIFISFTDPKTSLICTAIAAIFIAFSSATQDIVLDAFRIESASKNLQGALSSMYLTGYRIAMIVAGAGSLWIASFLGTEIYNQKVWQQVYQIMALLMLFGVLTVFYSSEPKIKRNIEKNSNQKIKFFIAFLVSLAGFILCYLYFKDLFDSKDPIINFLNEFIKIIFCFLTFSLIIFFLIKIKFLNKESAKNAYAKPVLDFLNRYGSKATSILLLIGLYRISDVVLGVMANVFYIEKGFSIAEIATYSKFFGTIATIVGGVIGGLASVHLGVMRSLFIGALISALSNILFAWLALVTADVKILAFVITADNVASGFAGATFIVYLSALTSIKFTATQYALFSSAMLFLPKLIAGYAGGFVNLFGYPTFFIFTAIIGVPVLLLIMWINKTIKINKK